MSRAVDVLAAMDEAAQEIVMLADRANMEGDPYDLQEARAAVAELIEAVQSQGAAETFLELRVARRRVASALARCQPEN